MDNKLKGDILQLVFQQITNKILVRCRRRGDRYTYTYGWNVHEFLRDEREQSSRVKTTSSTEDLLLHCGLLINSGATAIRFLGQVPQATLSLSLLSSCP